MCKLLLCTVVVQLTKLQIYTLTKTTTMSLLRTVTQIDNVQVYLKINKIYNILNKGLHQNHWSPLYYQI